MFLSSTKESPATPSPRTRQAAKTIVTGMRVLRRGNEQVSKVCDRFCRVFCPARMNHPLLPNCHHILWLSLPSLVPLVVVTIASVVYFRYGRSVQYEEYLVQARNARAIAIGLTDPIAQREAWQQELSYLNNAESNSQTTETQTMRQEAQAKLDQLEGISRLQFQPVVSGLNAQDQPHGRR